MRNPNQFAAVYTVLHRQEDDHVFLLQRQNTGYYDDFWNLPAGHVEPDEMPIAAAIRETQEEAGVTLTPDSLTFKTVLHRVRVGERTYTDYLFTANQWQGEPHNAEPEKASTGKWFPLNNLPTNIVPNQRTLLHCLANDIAYQEFHETESNDKG